MAEPITIQKLIDASIDSYSLEIAVNGDENTEVTTRLNRQYPSVARAIHLIMQSGGWDYFDTEAELLLSAPVDRKVAYAADTKKLYKFNEGSWSDEGLSQYGQAISYIDSMGLKSKIATDENGDEYIFALINEYDDELAYGIKANGEIVTPDMSVIASDDITINDASGNTFIRLSEDEVYIAGVTDSAKSAHALPCLYNQIKPIDFNNTFSDINYIIGYGQSLSRGTVDDAITVSQPYENIMLASGTLTRAGDAGYDPSEFVAMREGVQTNSETPTSSMCNGIVYRYVSQFGDDKIPVFSGSAHGMGNRRISRLIKGGSDRHYENMMQQITDNKALADRIGKSFCVQAMVFSQGESDADMDGENRIPYQWSHQLILLKKQVNTDCMAITGQDFEPIIVIQQSASHFRHGNPKMGIALAQLQTSKTDNQIIMSHPNYHLPKISDHLHFTPESCWLSGQYTARALYAAIYKHQKFQPLQPVFLQLSDDKKEFVVTYNNSTQLQISDYLCEYTVNYGFDVWSGDSLVSNAINSVKLQGFNQIKVTLNEPFTDTQDLCFARGRITSESSALSTKSSRGNIHDSDGDFDIVTSPLGNEFKLHNASVMWQWNQKQLLDAL